MVKLSRTFFAQATKEIFIPTRAGTEQYTSNRHTGYRIDADGEEAFCEFLCPHDFINVKNLQVVYIALATIASMIIRVQTDVAAAGETVGVTLGSANPTRDVVANTLYEEDISSALTNMAARDYVAVRFTRGTGENCNALILGVRLKY